MQPRAVHFVESLSDRRMAVAFLIGISSGFPWVLHGSVLTLWMQSEGLSRSAIGYIGVVATIYSINWVWAPLVDQFRIPLLHRMFGQYRSWILLCQALLILLMWLISSANPADSLLLVGLYALGISSISATQDVAIDAYRVKLFSRSEMDEKIPYASALAGAGWQTGFTFLGGTLALLLGGETFGFSWPEVYRLLTLFMLALMLIVVLSPPPCADDDDPRAQAGAAQSGSAARQYRWLRETLIDPFGEFFQRCGLQLAVGILLFLFSFRLGEAMLGRMSLIFYVELGFSNDEIALYRNFLGGGMTIVFSLIGAFINTRFGIVRGMLVGGIAMAASNLLYAVMAEVGPAPWLFVVTLLVDNFTAAFATVCAVSFISYFASRTYTGTQFALMTSISNFGRTTLAAGSGAIVDGLGGNWALFFVLTTLMVIPALIILFWLSKLLENHRTAETGTGESPSA
ncbi:MAG: AmpG family muropeptide MFS transporter [Gammaproteobacteria bacterium]|nr:AmpG family muropeptide MFS transporter [Gammaproteobacteria bacterium]